jgi:hypothetical protein
VKHLYGTYDKTRNTKVFDSKKSSSWSIEDHSKNSKVIQTNFTQHKRNHPVNQSRSNSDHKKSHSRHLQSQQSIKKINRSKALSFTDINRIKSQGFGKAAIS